jgi:hypothetical protein
LRARKAQSLNAALIDWPLPELVGIQTEIVSFLRLGLLLVLEGGRGMETTCLPTPTPMPRPSKMPDNSLHNLPDAQR